jgi:signal transduction histidine kinase
MEASIEQYAKHLEALVEEKTRQLKDAERLSAIGQTAGMVGHDIRNPLQAIVGELYLAKDGLVSLPESDAKQALKENVFMIEEQVEYINKIVTDLQDFAKPLIPCKEEVHLETVVKSVLPTINIPENIQVVYSPETEPRFIADSAYIKRIVQNLVSNAVQAMPRGGKLTLQTRRENNTAILTVEDTGVGIPEEAKTRLFQPLFTTKSKGQGFGLAVCKRLVESMNGTITFESEEGKGTKFTVKLPVNHQKMLNSAAKTT